MGQIPNVGRGKWDPDEMGGAGEPEEPQESAEASMVDKALGLEPGDAETMYSQAQLEDIAQNMHSVAGAFGATYSLEEQASIAQEMREIGYDGSRPLTPELLDLGRSRRELQGLAPTDADSRASRDFQSSIERAAPAQDADGRWYVSIPGQDRSEPSLAGEVGAEVAQQVGDKMLEESPLHGPMVALSALRELSDMEQQGRLAEWNGVLSRPRSSWSEDDRRLDRSMRSAVEQSLRSELSPGESQAIRGGDERRARFADQEGALVENIQARLRELGAFDGRERPDRMTADR